MKKVILAVVVLAVMAAATMGFSTKSEASTNFAYYGTYQGTVYYLKFNTVSMIWVLSTSTSFSPVIDTGTFLSRSCFSGCGCWPYMYRSARMLSTMYPSSAYREVFGLPLSPTIPAIGRSSIVVYAVSGGCRPCNDNYACSWCACITSATPMTLYAQW